MTAMDDPLYHFTSETNWEWIKDWGYLEPTSRQLTPEDMFSDEELRGVDEEVGARLEKVREEVRERNDFWDREFVCAAGAPGAWAEAGALHDLVPHMQRGHRTLVRIDIPPERIDPSETYVVDMAPYGARRFEADLGYDPTDLVADRIDDHDRDDTGYLVDRWCDVCLSTTPLSRYEGGHAAPEYWIGHDVPVDGLETERVTGHDLLRMEPAAGDY